MNRVVATSLAIALSGYCSIASARFIQGDPVGVVPLVPSPALPAPTMSRAITASDVLRFHRLNHSYAYVDSNPLAAVDPYGLSSIVFNRRGGTMDVYDDVGKLQFSCSAGNNVTPWAKGPFPSGTFSFSHYNQHPESGPTGPFGSFGIFIFNVPGRTGMGVHSGRQGPQSPTLGCVRTDDPCMGDLNDLHQKDPIKSITVR
jgi:hypothetical protein